MNPNVLVWLFVQVFPSGPSPCQPLAYVVATAVAHGKQNRLQLLNVLCGAP